MAQFDGISWDKDCQETGPPLLNTEWTRIESPPVVDVSCQLQIYQFHFSKQKSETWGFENVVNLDKREVIKYATLLMDKSEGERARRRTFWVNLSESFHSLQLLKADLIHQQPFCGNSFLMLYLNFCRLSFFAELFWWGICQWWGCERMQSDEPLKGCFATEYWWEKGAKMDVSKS